MFLVFLVFQSNTFWRFSVVFSIINCFNQATSQSKQRKFVIIPEGGVEGPIYIWNTYLVVHVSCLLFFYIYILVHDLICLSSLVGSLCAFRKQISKFRTHNCFLTESLKNSNLHGFYVNKHISCIVACFCQIVPH